MASYVDLDPLGNMSLHTHPSSDPSQALVNIVDGRVKFRMDMQGVYMGPTRARTEDLCPFR